MTHSIEIPGYEILDLAGEGGMAKVWRARQVSLDRIVAIKVMNTENVPDREVMIKQFQQEARAAGKLNHPGIVQIYDAGYHSPYAYYIMEYVDGHTVSSLLDAVSRIPEAQALLIAEGVAHALDWAWQNHSIIHCDIKPDNIMIDRDGTVKVADLGLARMMGNMSQHVLNEDITGTPNYASPEQARGDLNLDCRTDIYSLGATLYHAMTGQLPFRDGKDPMETMNQQISGFITDAYEYGVSLETSMLLENMLVKDRKDRPSNWVAVGQDIELVTQGLAPITRSHPGAKSTLLCCEARRKAPPPAPPNLLKTAQPAPVPQEPKVQKPAQRIVLTTEEKQALSNLPKKKRSPWATVLLQLAILSILVAGAVATLHYLRPDLFKPADTTPKRLSAEDLPPRSQYRSDDEQTTATQGRASRTGRPQYNNEPAHTVRRTSSARPSVSGAIDWHDEDFMQAVAHYNHAVELFEPVRQGQKEAELPLVEETESDCLEAIRLFEACKSRAPENVPIQRFVRDTNRLLSDVRFILRGL